MLNGGNEVEIYKYPELSDRIYSQVKYADSIERNTRDASPMLIATSENT